MKVVVTGAAGYVGSALAALLASRGHYVIGVDNDARRLASLRRMPALRTAVELHVCGLDELVRTADLLAGADALVHLAGMSSDAAADRDVQATHRINVDLAKDLALASRETGIMRFVLASTAAIYQVPVNHRLEHEIFYETDEPPLGEPVGSYSRSKLDAERALAPLSNERFTVVVLRKGSLYGYSATMRWDLVINRMALNAWLGQPLVLHDLGAVWRPIAHVQDAARAYVHLLELPSWSTNGLAFNLVERNARLSEVCLEVDDVLRSETHRSIVFQHGTSPRPQRTGRVSGESLRRVGWRPLHSLRSGVTDLLRRLESRQVELPEEVLTRRGGRQGTAAAYRGTSARAAAGG
jgi:nucleoside-diphosphate-sugar epimerase